MGHTETLPLSRPSPYAYEAYTYRPQSRWQRSATALILVLALLGAIQLRWPIRASATSSGNQALFQDGLQRCAGFELRPDHEISSERRNPRWNSATGQQKPILLRNATVFDGEHFLKHKVDVLLERGIVKTVTPTADGLMSSDDVEVVDLRGKHVTPGIVDMHSHHLVWPFHALPAIRDVNETPLLGPLTPFVRSIDGMKAYDPAIEVIAGGGVTTSLILPGSSNIIGGEAYIVKNAYLSGKDREAVVEDLLLDHGLPDSQRQRYVKMACGENPKHTYLHTRLGNAWLLREHFAEAKEILNQQSSWCQAASALANKRFSVASEVDTFVRDAGSLPHLLKYDTTIAMLRGQANVNIHCYEPEDFERMLSVLHEFGVHPRAFHHALEAWQVPEFLKRQEGNITIATFAENAFFKAEAYGASLRAGKILNDHGIPVAYKSDHTGEGNNAKYVLHQAAIAHSFGLPADKALQSVTSVPARSLQQDHRVGFIRPGYDADLAVWDSHPLTIGATAIKVYIDGNSVLKPDAVANSLEKVQSVESDAIEPRMRATISPSESQSICDKARNGKVIFTGIRKNFLDRGVAPTHDSETGNLTLVLDQGELVCLGHHSDCAHATEDGATIALEHGYVLPGLTAVSQTLGLVEISGEPSTSDGYVEAKSGRIDYAKYGVQLNGRALGRARIGGITRAVVAPLLRGGLIKGVSVAYRTSGKRNVLDGGIVKEDVALHFELSEASKTSEPHTISGAIGELRKLLSRDNHAIEDDVLDRAAKGEIPVVVHVVNTDLIRQLIWFKRDLPQVNLVIFGGHGAVHVASELATAGVPVILTGNRGVPDTWAKRDALSGPPLTRSPAQVLADAGVLFALAINGDSHVHNLASEAGWAAKYAGLNESEALKLVAGNVEKILGLEKGDFVVWEGNPFKGEGSVVVSVEDDGVVGTCWPDEE